MDPVQKLLQRIESQLEVYPSYAIKETLELAVAGAEGGKPPITEMGEIIQDGNLDREDLKPVFSRLSQAEMAA